MEANLMTTGRKRRRERKKSKRRKVRLDDEDLLKISTSFKNDDEIGWDVPVVGTILHKSRPSSSGLRPTLPRLDGLIGPNLVKILAKSNAKTLMELSRRVELTNCRCRKIRMRRVLSDHVPKQMHRKMGYLVSHPLNRKQLDAFTAKLLSLLFKGDGQLLDPANTASLRANIVNAFIAMRSGKHAIVSRKELCRGVRYSRMGWLEGVPFRLKEAVGQNLLKSILELFTGIFTAHFYSTLNYEGRIVHYRRDVYRRIARESFDLLRAERKLQAVDNLGVEHVHGVRFLPKRTSTRPIVILSEPAVKLWLAEVRAVISYAMSRAPEHFGWGISSIRLFQLAYRRFLVRHKRVDINRQVHFCTADLRSCYTSLEHDFLERVLQNAFPAQRTFTVLSAQVRNAVCNYTTLRTVAGANYPEALARLINSRPNELAVTNPAVREVTGAELLERVRRFTMRTVVRMPGIINGGGRQGLFQCNRGIAQGNQLSVSLCNLYLGAMERIVFPERPQRLLCRRYVDDYIMMAYAKEEIQEALNALLKRAPEFGLAFGHVVTSFREAHLQPEERGNARILRPNEKIAWCGLALNTHSLSMSIDYRRYLNRRPNYTFPSNLHSSEHFQSISKAMVKVLKGRFRALRNVNSVWPAKRRRALNKGFCQFAYFYYLRNFVEQLGLNAQDQTVCSFMAELMRWTFRNFRREPAQAQMTTSL